VNAKHETVVSKVVTLKMSPLEFNIIAVALAKYFGTIQEGTTMLWESNMGTAKTYMVLHGRGDA
jgi:hypothetical protein